MRPTLWRPQWQNFKEMLQSGTVNYSWRHISCNEAGGTAQACFSSFPHAFPTPSFPIPQRLYPPLHSPRPPGSAGLCQWELYSGIPSQRQEPPGLEQPFPLTVMLFHTNQMLSAEWFRITELPNWHIVWVLCELHHTKGRCGERRPTPKWGQPNHLPCLDLRSKSVYN